MMFLNKSRKGQSALEFVILIGFALLMISVLLVVFQNNLVRVQSVREEVIVDQMFNLILSEIEFAELSKPVYNRTFYLPNDIGGYSYDLFVRDGVEIVLEYMGVRHVRFLTTTKVEGDFSVPGRNYISKQCLDCNVSLNS